MANRLTRARISAEGPFVNTYDIFIKYVNSPKALKTLYVSHIMASGWLSPREDPSFPTRVQKRPRSDLRGRLNGFDQALEPGRKSKHTPYPDNGPTGPPPRIYKLLGAFALLTLWPKTICLRRYGLIECKLFAERHNQQYSSENKDNVRNFFHLSLRLL